MTKDDTMTWQKAELVDRRFGDLVVKEFAEMRKGKAFWLCLCDCGTQKVISGNSLARNRTVSCGCRKWKHGMYGTSEWNTWQNIKARCYNTNDKDYVNYGNRGITVCDEWLTSFITFYKDMGPKPGPEYSIERKENDGPYTKDNCVWATMTEQNRNKRTNHIIEYKGQHLCLSEVARLNSMPRSTLRDRLKAGWSKDKALATPVRVQLIQKV